VLRAYVRKVDDNLPPNFSSLGVLLPPTIP